MTTKIIPCLITIVAIFATCLEGRYHLDATGLRHHRHDRHHQVWEQDSVTRGSRRRDREENDDEETALDRQRKERLAVSSGRRIPDRNIPFGHDRGVSSGTAHRGRYEPPRRGRGRNEGRHTRRDYYHGNSASSWVAKGQRKDNRHVTSSSGRGERPWNYQNPYRHDKDGDDEVEGYDRFDERRRGRYNNYDDDDDDDDDGYEADDEEYYPPRKGGNPYQPHSKGWRKRPEPNNNWRDERRWKVDEEDNNDEDYDDYYDQEYDDYDVQETKKRPSRKRHNKRNDDFDDSGFEKKKEVNDVPGGRRGGGKKKDRFFTNDKETREKPEDVNEVEEDHDVEDEIWGDTESDDDDGGFDEYDETEASDFYANDSKEKSNLKTIDDIIRRLSAGDRTTTTTTLKPNSHREYRNIVNDYKHPVKDRYGNSYETKTTPKIQPHRWAHNRKSENTWETLTTTTAIPPLTTTTTTKPRPYAKITFELNRLTNSSRNDVGTVINKKITRVKNGTTIDVRNPLIPQLNKTDPDTKTKSSEQDYEDYENDGNDDKPEDIDDVDADTENDKKLPSEKDPDYNEEENAEENDDEMEKPIPTTTLPVPLTTMRTTTTSTTTTTTTSTTTPPPIFTRAFNNRHPRILDPAGSRANSFKHFQTTLTTTPYPTMSNYSAYKWQTLGSRKGINDRRNTGRVMDIAEIEIRNALLNAEKIKRETQCQWPKPRVVSVREIHPSPSKIYRPSCIMLHRCADDTGCCDPEDTCVPKHLLSVEFSVYSRGIDGSRSVEKLKFENHTECQCRPRPPPPPPPPPPTTTMKPCRCPSDFTIQYTRERRCQCDCRNNDLRCIKQKKGKEDFPPNDQWCITTGECTMPSCQFGEYNRMLGRCPQRSATLSKAKHHNNSNVRYGY